MSSDQSGEGVQHSDTNNDADLHETMNADNDTAEVEETNEWHGIPQMIGEAINNTDYGVHHWGGYIVRRTEDDAIAIHRVVDQATTRDELETESDYVADMWDYVLAGEDCGYISPPEEGWESETEHLPESIFGGYE
ncbi:hypothetical protein [Natronorubrum daqingense]|uniref:Uncharacterized protein n=1 Tax=Natronorubrum daqingense TaxID=588898 RepID=A0A1N7G558_9EURY|nr:hypothetical protein [Natronorubrum daqingense]APX98721.1 hypothetical protein BB347_18620 [Natronorubrum daqingense]SIS07739.1 hypothetical protein SAMN05421809_3737 [Natronorubrum daqingense]